MSYQQLTLEEREVISQMHYSGSGPTAIARCLDRSPSTISRELSRNCSPQGYRAVTEQKQTSKRRRERSLARKMDDPQINEAVRTGLSQEWSPEQIAGRQQRDHPNQPSRCVSRQTIYRWLETCEYRSHFRSYLRHGRTCVTVGIANDVAWTVEAASGIAPASKTALQKLIPDVASVTGKATPFTVQDTRA
jgi:transposase, IS30 family